MNVDQWLENRREELKDLKFKHFETTLWREQKELLRENGYFVYDLRDWDNGRGYNIEVRACVNNIGNWITDIDLTPYMNNGCWIGIDELKNSQIDEIPYDEIKDILQKGKELHFNK